MFTGAAIYINLAEHPARMECGTQLAATVFGSSYRRGVVMQVILAVAATIGGIGAWFMGAPRAWFVGAVLIFAVIPFTLIVIMPTNRNCSIRDSTVLLLRHAGSCKIGEYCTRFGAFLVWRPPSFFCRR